MNLENNEINLASGWRRAKLGEICEVVTGNTPPKGEISYYGGTIPWIKPDNLGKTMYVEESSEYLTDEGGRIARILPPGTVLVSCIGNLGKCAIAKKALATNQQINALIPCEDIDSEYLYFVCSTLHQQLNKIAAVTIVPIVNKSAFSALQITVPPLTLQRSIAASLKIQLVSVDEASSAAKVQLDEITNLANAIIRQSVEHPETDSTKLGDVLDEVKKGIGKTWAEYPVLGATRAGLALAKEPVGKIPERYKPVLCGTVFYNPMRIMIGSIAMVDENDTPGITSPDYVALRGKPGLVDSRWFYYWLRSPYGVSCIASLARGAVRERMLFNRLADGNIELPPYAVQVAAAKALAELTPMQTAIKNQLRDINLLPAKILAGAFES